MTDVIDRPTAAISATADISKLDRRCRGWAIVVRANQPLPMPVDVTGASSLHQPYAHQSAEGVELFPGDYALWGEEEHHRKNRGWVYVLFAYHESGTAEHVAFRSEVKEQIKAAIQAGSCTADPNILRGSGDVAAMVRRIHADRAGFKHT